jgi:hypothetical protein
LNADEQLELARSAVLDDAVTVQKLAAHLRHALGSSNWGRAYAYATALTSCARLLGARLEYAAAFEAGANAVRAEPGEGLPRRRRPKVGPKRGHWEYLVKGDWLTSEELANRYGTSYGAMRTRIRRGWRP